MLTLVRLALRNLSRNRRRTVLAAMAIVIGISAMVVFRGFVNGMRQVVIDNLVQGQAGALQIYRAGYLDSVEGLPLTLDFEDTAALREKIEAVEGVRAVAPRITFGAMLSTPDLPGENGELRPGQTSYFIATAADPVLEPRVLPRRFHFLLQGRPFQTRGGPEILLSQTLFDGLPLSVWADAAQRPDVPAWPALLAADRDGALNGENVVVSGTLGAGMPGDRRSGLVPLETAQRLLRMEGRITTYVVAMDEGARLEAVKARLQQALGSDFEVRAWNELLPFVEQLVNLQDFLMSLIAGIFLVIVLLGIVNALLMNVMERIREIGTMMAVGVRRRQILLLMVLEGAALGMLGGVGGILLGSAVVAALFRRGVHLSLPGAVVEEAIRPFVTAPNVAIAVVVAVVGASLAALWPAWRASRLRPVEALRAP